MFFKIGENVSYSKQGNFIINIKRKKMFSEENLSIQIQISQDHLILLESIKLSIIKDIIKSKEGKMNSR